MDFALKFKGYPTKCDTCSSAVIYETRTDKYVNCQQLEKSMTEPILECSAYLERNSMALWQMEEKAWILEVKKGKPIGFQSPADRRKNGQDV